MDEKQIEKLRHEQKDVLEKMDIVAREFITATAQQLAAELLTVTKRVCKPQKEINKKLGENGLRKLVKDVGELAPQMSTICQQFFYRDTVWLHLNWAVGHRYKNDSRKSCPWAPGARETNDRYGWAFIDSIDALGALLVKAGFETNTKTGYEGYSVKH